MLTSFFETLIKAQVCIDSFCSSGDGPHVKFPFRLKFQQDLMCGFPGFELTCNANLETTIEIQGSGNFSVKGINYDEQEIWINDPMNCLPERLLKFNLTRSPFAGVQYQDYLFFNCSTQDYLRYGLNPIACLSSRTFTVFATSSEQVIRMLSNSEKCVPIANIPVPMELPFFQEVSSSDLNNDLRLTWATPSCGNCESRGGRCGFKSNSSREIVCSRPPPSNAFVGIPRSVRYAMVAIGVPLLLCLMALTCYVSSKFCGPSRRTIESELIFVSQPNMGLAGLDRPTLESFPKIVLGQSGHLPKLDDNTCSICLSEYKPKETLKTIPQCQHCFHVQCIDEWLQLNATCPVCRHSPEPAIPETAE